MSFAFSGFVLLLLWYFRLLAFILTLGDPSTTLQPHHRVGKLGALLFGVGWFLALISSLDLIRHARNPPPPLPPTH